MSAVRTCATEVVFVLLPDVVLLDVAGPADAFRNAASRVPGSYRLRFVAPQPALAAAVTPIMKLLVVVETLNGKRITWSMAITFIAPEPIPSRPESRPATNMRLNPPFTRSTL